MSLVFFGIKTNCRKSLRFIFVERTNFFFLAGELEG